MNGAKIDCYILQALRIPWIYSCRKLKLRSEFKIKTTFVHIHNFLTIEFRHNYFMSLAGNTQLMGVFASLFLEKNKILPVSSLAVEVSDLLNMTSGLTPQMIYKFEQ